MNQIVLMGRLTADPELRHTQNGTPVASFTVAVDRRQTEKATDFIPCSAWQKTGENISKFFRKGNLILVTGSLQSRQWEDRDGKKRTNWEVIVFSFEFTGEKRDKPETINVDPPDFKELDDDGELPF